jgi:hypothetical protein
MVTILLVVVAMALLYGLIQLSEAAFQRWLPHSALGRRPIAIDNGPILDNSACGITGMAVDSTGTGVGSAIATEIAGETAAISEAIAPIVESAQGVISHGAAAIGHAVGEVLSGL